VLVSWQLVKPAGRTLGCFIGMKLLGRLTVLLQNRARKGFEANAN
jgi:hypothetical protein